MKKSDLNLDKLFGKDRAQEDENLTSYFVETTQYKDIESGSKELILGRKGAGKSSLFSYLATDLLLKNQIPILISPDGEEYARVLGNVQLSDGLKYHDDFKYSLAWQEFILTEISFSVIGELRNKLIFDTDSILYKRLIQNGKIKGDFVSRFSNALVKAFSNGKFFFDENIIDLDFADLQDLDTPEKDEIKKSFQALLNKNQFCILIDNLDEPWTNSEQMNSWLRGLILSMRRLKREFKNLKIITFLRDDIYSEIASGSDLFDSENEILKINWKDANNYSLRQLLATRIATYFNQKETLGDTLADFDRQCNKLFPSHVEYGYKKVRKPLSTYIIERTFSRPREFLQFCRLIIEKSQSEKLPVSSDSIHIAEGDYSSWKFRDLTGEFSHTYNNINKHLLSYANASKNWSFDYTDLNTHYDSLDDSEKVFHKIENRHLSLLESIEFLYKSGFFRKIVNTPGRRTSLKVVTSFEEPEINYKKAHFDIHPAFRKKLANI